MKGIEESISYLNIVLDRNVCVCVCVCLCVFTHSVQTWIPCAPTCALTHSLVLVISERALAPLRAKGPIPVALALEIPYDPARHAMSVTLLVSQAEHTHTHIHTYTHIVNMSSYCESAATHTQTWTPSVYGWV